MHTRDDIFAYAKKNFDANPDYPFEKFPHYAVLRHSGSEKWFALVMLVPRSKLGIDGDGDVEVIDVKVNPDKLAQLRKRDGILPAYHMNKEHWITILLDGPVSRADIHSLLHESYELTS
ncbi:MmcQ/YjbR family DNA-binding protein [Xanthomonas hortorum]|uniref:MmcQ/YjbR family DNA-binding protein n=1 Tax=Xanthomonas hortorum TaxID=56454 RepID=UPI00159375C5|nr:MmcQ/YjbR family DNA-binding protein [Xanthomonas hortorum]NHF65962.1 MmcQ/YjbR family DNA-binding protein [Xanthomonas hortorum]